MLLSVQSLTKTFPGTRALDGVDFELAAGEVHALLGENGAGKSTLIKCLTGAYRRDAGEIRLEGARISPRSTSEAQELGIGTVYQEVNLLPNLTVAQNLAFGREPRRFGLVDGRAMRAMARETLMGYGLDIDVGRDLGCYSVAIRQIIAIARAVALSGKVLILDEPTASLDAREVEMLFDVVRGLRDRGLGIVFVSHFLDQVFALSDRVTVLRNGQKVVTEATRDLDRVRLIEHMLGRVLEDEVVAQAAGHGGHVHRGVAAADDQHLLRAMLQAAVVERLEEGDAGDAVVGLGRAGNVDRRAGLRADADEDGVVIGLDSRRAGAAGVLQQLGDEREAIGESVALVAQRAILIDSNLYLHDVLHECRRNPAPAGRARQGGRTPGQPMRPCRHGLFRSY